MVKVVIFLVDLKVWLVDVEVLCGFCVVFEVKYVVGDYVLIVEIKKVSLLKGLICVDFDLLFLVRVYEDGGVVCLLVLMDMFFF